MIHNVVTLSRDREINVQSTADQLYEKISHAKVSHPEECKAII